MTPSSEKVPSDDVKELRRDLRRLTEAVEQLARQFSEEVHQDRKWRKIFKQQLGALLRHVCIPLHEVPAPLNLTLQRFRIRSQNEEDGVLLALLDRTGWGTRRFVEIGSGSTGGNAAFLAYECGWHGLMVDAVAANTDSCRRLFARNGGITCVTSRVMPANVNALLEEHGYGGEVDVLSIDIDSYDYWVLQAITVCSPRILIVEYNALFGPERSVTIPLAQTIDGAPKGYGGASLAALSNLMEKRGYRLVACEEAGVNAFFLRRDVATDIRHVPAAMAFRPLRGRRDLDDAEVATDIYEVARRARLPLVDV